MPNSPEKYLQSLTLTIQMMRQDLRQQLEHLGLERMQSYGLDITSLFCLYDDLVKMETALKHKLEESDFKPVDELSMDSLWSLKPDKEE
jgi:hypothetical protein